MGLLSISGAKYMFFRFNFLKFRAEHFSFDFRWKIFGGFPGRSFLLYRNLSYANYSKMPEIVGHGILIIAISL